MIEEYDERTETLKRYIQVRPLYTLTSNDTNLEGYLYSWLSEILEDGLELYLVETSKDWRKRYDLTIIALPSSKITKISGGYFVKRRRLDLISKQTKKYKEKLFDILNNFYTAITQKNLKVTHFSVFTDCRKKWTLWFSVGDADSVYVWEQLGFICIADLASKYPKREMTIVEELVERADLVDWVWEQGPDPFLDPEVRQKDKQYRRIRTRIWKSFANENRFTKPWYFNNQRPIQTKEHQLAFWQLTFKPLSQYEAYRSWLNLTAHVSKVTHWLKKEETLHFASKYLRKYLSESLTGDFESVERTENYLSPGFRRFINLFYGFMFTSKEDIYAKKRLVEYINPIAIRQHQDTNWFRPGVTETIDDWWGLSNWLQHRSLEDTRKIEDAEVNFLCIRDRFLLSLGFKSTREINMDSSSYMLFSLRFLQTWKNYSKDLRSNAEEWFSILFEELTDRRWKTLFGSIKEVKEANYSMYTLMRSFAKVSLSYFGKKLIPPAVERAALVPTEFIEGASSSDESSENESSEDDNLFNEPLEGEREKEKQSLFRFIKNTFDSVDPNDPINKLHPPMQGWGSSAPTPKEYEETAIKSFHKFIGQSKKWYANSVIKRYTAVGIDLGLSGDSFFPGLLFMTLAKPIFEPTDINIDIYVDHVMRGDWEKFIINSMGVKLIKDVSAVPSDVVEYEDSDSVEDVSALLHNYNAIQISFDKFAKEYEKVETNELKDGYNYFDSHPLTSYDGGFGFTIINNKLRNKKWWKRNEDEWFVADAPKWFKEQHDWSVTLDTDDIPDRVIKFPTDNPEVDYETVVPANKIIPRTSRNRLASYISQSYGSNNKLGISNKTYILRTITNYSIWDVLGPVETTEWMEPPDEPEDEPDSKIFMPLRFSGHGIIHETEEQILALIPEIDQDNRDLVDKDFFKQARRRRYVKRAVLGQSGVPFSKSGVSMLEALEAFISRGWLLSDKFWLDRGESVATKIIDTVWHEAEISSNIYPNTDNLDHWFEIINQDGADMTEVLYILGSRHMNDVASLQYEGFKRTATVLNNKINSIVSSDVFISKVSKSSSSLWNFFTTNLGEPRDWLEDDHIEQLVTGGIWAVDWEELSFDVDDKDQLDFITTANRDSLPKEELEVGLTHFTKETLNTAVIHQLLYMSGTLENSSILRRMYNRVGVRFAETYLWTTDYLYDPDQWMGVYGLYSLEANIFKDHGGEWAIRNMLYRSTYDTRHDESLELGPSANFEHIIMEDLDIEAYEDIDIDVGEPIIIKPGDSNFEIGKDIMLSKRQQRKRLAEMKQLGLVDDVTNRYLGLSNPAPAAEQSRALSELIMYDNIQDHEFAEHILRWDRMLDERINSFDESHVDQGGLSLEEIALKKEFMGHYRLGPFQKMTRRPVSKQVAKVKWSKMTYKQKWHRVPLVPTYYYKTKGVLDRIVRPNITERTPMGYSNIAPRKNWFFFSWGASRPKRKYVRKAKSPV